MLTCSNKCSSQTRVLFSLQQHKIIHLRYSLGFKGNHQHLNKTILTLDSIFLWVVVQNWYNTIFWIEDPDPGVHQTNANRV